MACTVLVCFIVFVVVYIGTRDEHSLLAALLPSRHDSEPYCDCSQTFDAALVIEDERVATAAMIYCPFILQCRLWGVRI